ncbi:MAG: aminoglycoside phosphotransferase family protein [Candidatus Nanohaloarchaeota archaeon QJJ-9]|nr:aminoglycoside phosphotransferase family protein [Candidatus Nanohaloarchaeota archaeon QJJ-9]
MNELQEVDVNELLEKNPEHKELVDTNHVYLVEHEGKELVIKYYSGKFSKDRYQREKRALQELKDYEIPVPDILGYDDSRKILLEEKIEGIPLQEVIETPEELNNYIKRVYQLEREVKRPRSSWKDGKNFQDFLKEVYSTDVINNLGAKIDKKTTKKLKKSVKSLEKILPSTYNLINGDLKGEEIYIDENGKINGIIDWENKMVGDITFDVSSMVNFFSQMDGWNYTDIMESLELSEEEKIRTNRYLGWWYGLWASYYHRSEEEMNQLLVSAFKLMESEKPIEDSYKLHSYSRQLKG